MNDYLYDCWMSEVPLESDYEYNHDRDWGDLVGDHKSIEDGQEVRKIKDGN